MSEMLDISRSIQVTQTETRLEKVVEDYSLERENADNSYVLAIKTKPSQLRLSAVNPTRDKETTEIS